MSVKVNKETRDSVFKDFSDFEQGQIKVLMEIGRLIDLREKPETFCRKVLAYSDELMAQIITSPVALEKEGQMAHRVYRGFRWFIHFMINVMGVAVLGLLGIISAAYLLKAPLDRTRFGMIKDVFWFSVLILFFVVSAVEMVSLVKKGGRFTIGAALRWLGEK